MRKGGSKQKGAQFERTICWALSRLVDPDGDDTLFWRSAMSGGRATVQNRKGVKNQTQLGDITAVSKKGNIFTEYFVVECKHYAKLDIESSILKGKGKLIQFWKELNRICVQHNRCPLLIAKQNRLETLVITNAPGMVRLRTYIDFNLKAKVSFRVKKYGLAHIILFKEIF